MKIALTGVTGFLGPHLLKELLGAGHDVTALIRNPNKLPASLAQNTSLNIIQGDLEGDLSDWVQGADCAVHLAGLIKARSLSDFMTVNKDGAGRVAKAAHDAAVPRFILLSSMVARQPELSGYAQSKSAGEAAVKAAYTHGALSIIRAPAVFGPNDAATKPIFDLLQKGLLPVAGGNWKNVRLAMIYVDDLVHVIAGEAIDGTYDGQTISPASIGAMSWHDFAKLASEALGRPVKTLPIPIVIMKPLAAITSVTSRVFGAGHLTLGKLREFRHPDWTSGEEIDNPTPMIEALRITAASYKKG